MGSLWNRSGVVERYADDLRASGAKAYFFNGGTTTPLTVFQNAGESAAHTHPVVADDNGRWPDVFVPYIQGYDVRVTSKDDVQLTFTLGIPNPNPVDTTVIVQPEQTVQTGMIHPEFKKDGAPKVGYVRLNGNTIGNDVSSASEMANTSLARNLFIYLWDNLDNTIAPVTPGGRGASAAADFDLNNKQIALPDMRGAGFVGLDSMGNTTGTGLAGLFAGLTFNVGNATTAGSGIGANAATIAANNLPNHTHSGTTGLHLGHVHQVNSITTGARRTDNSTQDHHHTHAWGSSGGTTIGSPPNTLGGFNTLDASVSLDHTHSVPEGSPQTGAGSQFVQAATTSLGAAATTSGVQGANPTLNHTHVVIIGGTSANESIDHLHVITAQTTALPTPPTPGEGAHTHTFSTDAMTGVGVAFNNLSVSRLVTWYIKL